MLELQLRVGTSQVPQRAVSSNMRKRTRKKKRRKKMRSFRRSAVSTSSQRSTSPNASLRLFVLLGMLFSIY
jgi:hypothetical protein